MISTNIQRKLEARAKHLEALEAKRAALKEQQKKATTEAAKALDAGDINESVQWEMKAGAAELEITSTQRVIDNLTASPVLSVDFVQSEWQEHCRQLAKDFAPIQKKTDKAIEALRQALDEYEAGYNALMAEQNAWGMTIESAGVVIVNEHGRKSRAWHPELPHSIKRPADLDLPE